MPAKKTDTESAQKPAETKTGRYVYDKNLKKVVKVDDDVHGLHKGSSHKCGEGCGCGGGSMPQMPMGGCGGCCEGGACGME